MLDQLLHRLRFATREQPQPSPKEHLLRRSLAFIRPFRRQVGVVMLLAGLLTLLSATEPLLMKWLFDELGAGHGANAILRTVMALLALEVARAILSAVQGVRSWDARLAVEYEVREQIVDQLSRLPAAYHQRETVGGIMNRMNQGIAGFINGFAELAFTLIPTMLYLFLAIAVMLRLDWQLSLVVLAFTPLPAVIGARAAAEQTRRERRLLERWTNIYSRFNEVLTGILTVKGFAMEDAEKRRFLDGVRKGFTVVRRGVRTDTITGTLRTEIAAAARLAAIFVGGLLVVRGQITIGTLVAFLGYLGGLFGPVQNLTNAYQTLRRATVSLETIFGILDAEDLVRDLPGAVEARPLRGEVEFLNVIFGYDPVSPVIRDVSLHVRPGEVVAVVGPSGSGKSTLLTLLQRHHPLTAGTILVDGQDIRTMTQRSLRRQIGIVLQDVHLFNDSVRANIAYGVPDASEASIEAAARDAYAHEFIMQLPKGYDTVIGERGSRLSGGQRQRLAIARALLKDPPILLLDEATSALDAESEALVQSALRRLTRQRTSFIVAHRLATVIDADKIVVLDEGRIVDVGNHEELVRRGGIYASMVRRQSQGFIALAPSAVASE